MGRPISGSHVAKDKSYKRVYHAIIDALIVTMHKDGLTVEEIHKVLDPLGLHPSQLSGAINATIARYETGSYDPTPVLSVLRG